MRKLTVWALVYVLMLIVAIVGAVTMARGQEFDAILNSIDQIAAAQSPAIDRCFRGPVPAKKVREQLAENGLYVIQYDRNGDGQIDLEALYVVKGGRQVKGEVQYEIGEYPLFYAVDTTKDMKQGYPDKVYIDKNGKGVCSEIELYRDLNTPHIENHNERPSANI
jgi:hypothetical protein